MAGSSVVNLSLLSRGIGKVKKNGSEKVDVQFEAEVSLTIINFFFIF